jgi:hypothetical protein
MVPFYGHPIKDYQNAAIQGLSSRADAPSSVIKMSHHDQSTKVIDQTSESKK